MGGLGPSRTRKDGAIHLKRLLIAGLWLLLGPGGRCALAQEETIVFEDDQQILTRLSENLSLDQISLRSFSCQEKLGVAESGSKGQAPARRDFLNLYKVERMQNREVATRATFRETRIWDRSSRGSEPAALPGFPILDDLFTGAINQMFDFENRFANDFHKGGQEVINGDSCQVLQFESVPQLTRQHLSILGRSVPLRQRGQLWVRVRDARLFRVAAKQVKLPKGCRSYQFQIDYHPQLLFGRSIYLPVHTQLTVELKEKRYVVEQEFFGFEALP